MPYMIVSKDGQHCVHKKNEDGTAGDSMKCYDSEDAADKYMKALYANADMAIHLQGESLDEKVSVIRDTFYQTFDQPVEYPSPCYIREVFDNYVIVEEGEQLFKVGYSTDAEGKVTFDERSSWKAVKRDYVEMKRGFSFTELSVNDLKKIDGLAAGTFVSMTGDEVTFKPEELQIYIDNTMKIIQSTTTEGGEIVGLPIDKDKHDHAGGAGWIVGLELDSARNIIRFLVNWTKDGMDLIKGNIRRFFSPSTDPNNKVILGGSLTNWPATRSETGQILLRPVELSQSMKEIDMEKTLLEMLADLPGKIAEAVRGGKTQGQPPEGTEPPATPEPEPISPTLKELLNTPEAIEELGQRATQLAQDAIKAEKRKMRAVEFAARIAGGTKEKPFGLAVRPNEIVALLLSLPEKQAAAVEKILEKSLDSAIDFAEHGYDAEGFIHKPTLPKELGALARKWVGSGKDIGSFFEANPELGKMDDFNISEFVKKEG